tara:strand:+ start:290 stop:1426 length:1137 start_codon:yes stop_codon:yes gene_type:complete
MKKIIYRKLAKDCINFFLLIIFTISIIIWVLQAVNYLDFVIEDGHGFFVYFKYTLLSFPKIFSRIYPFAVFIAFSYIILKYEERNELIIFWNFGIKKINFINFFIKFSFCFVLLSLMLNAIFAPLTQDKARSFIRSSGLDFFESILKPKKFIAVVNDLTIYFDEKNKKKELKNIFLNDSLNANNTRTTFAKKGVLETREDTKILVLYDGKTINYVNGNISEFKFTKTDFNITRFSSKTTTTKKTQETSTKHLMKCLKILQFSNIQINFKRYNLDRNCGKENLENIYEELYSRLIKPFYIILLVAISLLFILKSKSDPTFKSFRIKIYFLGFISIVFLESSSKFISNDLLKNSLISVLPFLFISIIYIYFLRTLRISKK